GDRPKPADGYHDQHVDEKVEAEGRIQSDDLDGKRATETCKAAAQRKRDAEDFLYLEDESFGHPLVVDGGADLRAKPGSFKAEHQKRGDEERDGNEENAVNTKSHAGDLDRPA